VTVLLLVGMMATGKTTIGTRVAQELGLEYWDNDALVQRLAGAAKQDLLAAQGESALRRYESGALELALASAQPVVAGVAGGALLDPRNLDRVQRARADMRASVVWLTAPVEVLVARLAREPAGRPWLGDDLEKSVRDLAQVREPGYRAVADLECDSGAEPDAVAARIVTWWRARSSG
jgi:shikimate kinase